jgi:NAD(P)-dependent dehydrogenase (short-subunit alcohol dehydrogenase family)
MHPFDMTNNRALVTGAGIGIGREVALEFARPGRGCRIPF